MCAFPFSKVQLLSLLLFHAAFNVHSSQPLYTLHPPFCKGCLAPFAKVTFWAKPLLKGWLTPQGLSQKAAGMNTCGW